MKLYKPIMAKYAPGADAEGRPLPLRHGEGVRRRAGAEAARAEPDPRRPDEGRPEHERQDEPVPAADGVVTKTGPKRLLPDLAAAARSGSTNGQWTAVRPADRRRGSSERTTEQRGRREPAPPAHRPMDFTLSAEQELIRALGPRVLRARDRCRTRASGTAPSTMDRAIVAKLAEVGFLGPRCPRSTAAWASTRSRTAS